MFGRLRAELRALGEIIDQHMKGDGFPFEKGVQASLQALHGTAQELDNRVHALEVAAGVKGRDDRPANVQAELDEAAQRQKEEAERAAPKGPQPDLAPEGPGEKLGEPGSKAKDHSG